MDSLSQLLSGPSEVVAPRLLGSLLVREVDGQQLIGKIVEVEAYDQHDVASHSYSGIIEASPGAAATTRAQSDDFLRPAVGTTTPGHKKIASSHPFGHFAAQPKPRLRQGETPRTKVMFGPPGHLYVYFTYGMHYCCNVVTGPVGLGSAVLIRALEPLHGMELMSANRHGLTGEQLTNGPAKLCQALQIDKSWNGHDLHDTPLQLLIEPKLKPADIIQTTRIGLSHGQDVPWRFYIRDSHYVSKV